MPISWPSSLQQKVNRDSFSLDKGDTTLRSDMDVGPAKVRRRFTKSVDNFSVAIVLKSINEYNTFINFFEITLNGGVNRFEFLHPITQVNTEFRFQGPPSITAIGGTVFNVNMKWEKLP